MIELAVCPICDRPIAWHDEQTARWCYRAWLSRDPRGLEDPHRVEQLRRRSWFSPVASPLLAALEREDEYSDAT